MNVDLDDIPVRSSKRYRTLLSADKHRSNEADNDADIDNYLLNQSFEDLESNTTLAKMQRRDRTYLWVVLLAIATIAFVYFLLQTKSLNRIFHSTSSSAPPKLILLWDRRTPFLDVKPYRLKKEISRSSLLAVSAGCNCEVTSDTGNWMRNCHPVLKYSINSSTSFFAKLIEFVEITAGWQLADAVVVNAFYLRRLNDFGHFFPRRYMPVQRSELL